EGRCRRLRGRGAGRPDASAAGPVVRVHHHPARGRARGDRSLRRARIHAVRRRAGREPDARSRRLAPGRRDAALALRSPGRNQFRRHLRGAALSDAASAARRPSWPTFAILALAVAGFALTVRVFYPGVMTWDAWYVHSYIAAGRAGDWQSPL